jgi:hypothetical protein
MKKGAATGAIAAMFSKGSKWGGLDIKRVYFGYATHSLDRARVFIPSLHYPGIGFGITVRFEALHICAF